VFASTHFVLADTVPPGEPARTPGSAPHLRAVLDGLAHGLLTFDDKLGVRFINARLAAMLEVPATVIARPPTLRTIFQASPLLDEATVQVLHEACTGAVRKTIGLTNVLTFSSHDDLRCFAVRVDGLDDGTWLAAFDEVTDRRTAEANAIEQAMRDPLTSLPNRQLFSRRADIRLAEATEDATRRGASGRVAARHAMLLIDLDRFKAVNDTLGHAIGDGLLRLVSKRLRSLLRQLDLIARLGGDEFALLVSPAPEIDDLSRLATRIVDVLGRPYLVDGHLVIIGASVGIAISPGDGAQHDDLLRSADLALYAAKKAGRNTFRFFEPVMDANALARRLMEIDLRKALPLQEFELFYQPQIDLERNQIDGFEALLRWRHPERGLVSPGDFIPLAEEIGMIVPLGEWVLREACREAARWPREMTVAVNVSPLQFTNTSRLIDIVGQALAASGLPGSRLEIEITESVLLRNEKSVIEALHKLRAMDVRVAMDDFGTGYSSLSQLHSFPFDKIKIDRSFLSETTDIAGQNAIIRAITALGVSLGMSTIAEGVETPDQLARIRAEGCNSVQGYLFSRPIPVDQIEGMILQFADGRPPGAQPAIGQPATGPSSNQGV